MADENGVAHVASMLLNAIIEAERGTKAYKSKDEMIDLYIECRRAVMSGKKAE